MTALGFQLPFFNYQSSQSTSASAFAGGSYAAASSSVCGNSVATNPGLFNGFNQLDSAVGPDQQQQQNMFMGMMQMFMQFMMMMMQMFMGNNQQAQQGQQPQQANNPLQNPANPAAAAAAPAPGTSSASSVNTPYGSSAAAASNTFVPTANNGINNSVMSQIDPKELEAVKGQDLGAVDKNGNPIFLVAKGKKDGKYHIYKSDGKSNGKKYKSVVKVKSGNNYLYVNNPAQNREAAANNKGNLLGYNVSAAAASSSTPWGNSSASAVSINPVYGPGLLENKSDYKTGSPLILDLNGNGKVDAAHSSQLGGKGINVDGKGGKDGAAVGGDGMLTLGDVNKDGKIDGGEVLGNNTVDPFTGQKIGAKNGFDALAKVAQSAEKHTGIKCMDENGNVDLQKLNQALEQSGKGKIGFISGATDNANDVKGLNTTNVKSINVSDYVNRQESGAVQHNQIGSYQTADGQTKRVDDVWFQLA